jgi:predicted transcriptional regulator
VARRPQDVTDAELEVLRALWDLGPATIRTLADRVYSARVAREALVARRLRETADQLCDGSLTPLLTHLVSAGRLSADELRELRRLVDRLSRER